MTIETVDSLLATLARGANADDGEPLDLLDHMLQCADLLATAAPDDIELQVAGLVHDIGTVLDPGGPSTHAVTGAEAVGPLLGTRVAELVSGHDHAKRYLVTAEPAYRAQLSTTSVVTLALQGGEMDSAERSAFEAGSHFEALVTLRRADDAAKVPGRIVPGLDEWRSTLERVGANRL